MLTSGLLNKVITLQHLKKEKDDYGSEVETWVDEMTCKCRVVTPSMSDNRKNLAGEILITDRLIFQTRKYHKNHFHKYSGMKHRIRYRCDRYYQILSIDDEGDDLIIFAQLIEQ